MKSLHISIYLHGLVNLVKTMKVYILSKNLTQISCAIFSGVNYEINNFSIKDRK